MRRTTRTDTSRAPRGGPIATTCICLGLVLVAVSAAAASSGTFDDALALTSRVAQRYGDASSYRIEFTQESFWALADTTVVSHGVLLARPPSLFSIRYDDGGSVLASAESLWVYVPQTGQYFCTPVDTVDVALDPVGILRAYKPDHSTPFIESSSGTATVLLRPSGAIPEPERLTITIDEKRSIVTSIVAHASSGDRTTYRMTDTAFDVPLPENAFVARRPAGAEVVRGQMPDAP